MPGRANFIDYQVKGMINATKTVVGNEDSRETKN
jgi:hypothetical protein